MSVSQRKIATVKWSNREYALIYCDDKQPGLIFGIVLFCEEISPMMRRRDIY